jgi:long-chain acyl-CoA synthetase
MTDTDIASAPRTIAELPFFASGRFPKPDAIGRCDASGVQTTSSREFMERIRDLSLGLSALGLKAGDRVALLSESRPEWLVADLAIVTAGAVTTPLYPTVAIEQIRAIIADSGATIAFASTREQLVKLRAVAATVPDLRTIITLDTLTPADTDPAPGAGAPTVLTLDEVSGRGHRQILDGWGVARAYQETAMRVRPEDPATLIYTSGTTGTPKGVPLTHGNMTSNVVGICQVLDLRHDDVALSFLPLCHAFERIVSYVYLTRGVSIVFAESVDTVARDLRVVRPTLLTGVPRVFEKLHARVLERGRGLPWPRRRLFDWGVSVAKQVGALAPGRAPGPALAMRARLADRLVFARVREGVGGRLRFAVSGGAPLRAEIGRFFFGMGVPILEGYGLTESSPVLCVMPLEKVGFGSVGPPLPNVELRIASDGEILARGPNIMSGYYGRPEETAEVLRDGWLHTGDIGSIDADGYLHITDRKKELLVTSGGKKIAPQSIEAALKASGVIDEAVLIADHRHYATALLVPAFAEIGRRLEPGPTPAPQDLEAAREFVARPDVIAMVQRAVDAVNEGLSQFERVKRFALLPRELAVATDELTPTLKVKRRVVERNYRDLIEAMYAQSGC